MEAKPLFYEAGLIYWVGFLSLSDDAYATYPLISQLLCYNFRRIDLNSDSEDARDLLLPQNFFKHSCFENSSAKLWEE
jgi:hypothetical protein